MMNDQKEESMIIRKLTTQPTKEDCNSSNHWNLCPFFYDGGVDTLQVEREWWFNQLLDSSRLLISSKFKSIDVVEQLNNNQQTQNDAFWWIYTIHLRQYDAQYWIQSLKTPRKLIQLSKRFVTFLYQLSTLSLMTGRLSESIVSDLQQCDEWNEINQGLVEFGESFVKLGQTSGKHDHDLRPIHKGQELIDYLCESRELYKCYDLYLNGNEFPIFLLIQPWNKKINENNEFRVFFYHGRVTAISQQKWFQSISINESKIKVMVESLINAINSMVVPYDSAVIDMYYDFDDESAHVIEFNPWGAWNASGSSLFHWVTDHSILYNQNDSVTFYYF